MKRVISDFWIAYANGAPLSGAWGDPSQRVKVRRERIIGQTEEPSGHPADTMSEDAWLKLTEAQRNRLVADYTGRRPNTLYDSSGYKDR